MKVFLSVLCMGLFVLITPHLSLACSFKVYCNSDRECVQSGGALYNACLEGSNSDNTNGQKVKEIVANKSLDIGEEMKLTIKMLQEYLRRKKERIGQVSFISQGSGG